jgi:hypothetical protein
MRRYFLFTVFIVLAIFSVLFISSFLGCGVDSNLVNNENQIVIYSQTGLIDSVYNNSGAYTYKKIELNIVNFKEANSVRINAKLNIQMALYNNTFEIWVGDSPWYIYSGAEGIIQLDTVINSPRTEDVLYLYLITNFSGDWISVRDLEIMKVN